MIRLEITPGLLRHLGDIPGAEEAGGKIREERKVSMLNIGCHLSVSKGYLHMGKEALSIEINTFSFYS